MMLDGRKVVTATRGRGLAPRSTARSSPRSARRGHFALALGAEPLGILSTSSSPDASDHPPWHVHVYQNGRLVVKWDLENKKPMKGKASARVLTLIAELEAEGRL